jgi:hypothetical protein
MNSQAELIPRRRPHLRFLVWGWVMLLVVLLSAAPTGGQVRSRLVGSAFDPATYSVALNPKLPKAKTLAKASIGRPPAALTDTPVLGAEAAVVLPAALPGRIDRIPLPDPLPAVPVQAGLSSKAHGARAPPLG